MSSVVPIHRVCVFSDVHFDVEHKKCWASFRSWHQDNRPAVSVAMGDMVDLGMLSRFEQGSEDQTHAVVQIRRAVEELNSVAKECGTLIVMPGNHEERWEKAIYGKNAPALKGATGLDLKSQYYAQGLNPGIRWVSESADNPGLLLGKKAMLVMHGHKQSTGWGIKNISSANLTKFPTVSTIVGHHHRAQMMCRTSLGQTIVSIANPHLSGSHEYNITPDWQRGFTVLEFYGRTRLRDCETFTPYVVVMDTRGRFVWNGKVYG